MMQLGERVEGDRVEGDGVLGSGRTVNFLLGIITQHVRCRALCHRQSNMTVFSHVRKTVAE